MNDKERAWAFEEQWMEERELKSSYYHQSDIAYMALAHYSKNGGMTEEQCKQLISEMKRCAK